MYNERAEYMKSVGKIAVTALITMAELWEQIEFEREDTFKELFDYYPLDKSFDEFVYEFSEWFDNWNEKI